MMLCRYRAASSNKHRRRRRFAIGLLVSVLIMRRDDGRGNSRSKSSEQFHECYSIHTMKLASLAFILSLIKFLLLSLVDIASLFLQCSPKVQCCRSQVAPSRQHLSDSGSMRIITLPFPRIHLAAFVAQRKLGRSSSRHHE